jgi:helix-turn-helix protein
MSVDQLDNRYTKILNAFVRDTRIPHTAFRIGAYVVGHAPEFRLTQASIAKALGMHRTTVLNALAALEELGYVRRVKHFTSAGRRPDTIILGQEPRTDAEWNELLSAHVGFPNVAETNVGKTDSVKRASSKKNKAQEDQPSGGDAAAASPPAEQPEEEMPKTAAPQESLFPGLEQPKKPRKAPALPEGPAAVVAAFVESYSQHHEGRRPLTSNIGKVGQAAKMILNREEATQEQLVLCAQAMGRTEWANLAQELEFSRKPRGRAGAAKSSRPVLTTHDDAGWDSVRSSVQGPEITDELFRDAFGIGA